MTQAFSYYLTIAAMFQNESAYLDEWLAFHIGEGVEHFLLYDNRSTDASREILQPWIAANLVTVIDWPIMFGDRAQPKAFNDALARMRDTSRWIAFLDIDEYLFAPGGGTAAMAMADYESYAGVAVNWQCYGTSGLKAKPDGFTIENYVRRAPRQWVRNRRVKSIVDPRLAERALGPHLFEYRDGLSAVTEKGKPVRPVTSPAWRRRLRNIASRLPLFPIDAYAVNESSVRWVSVDRLRINHYVTRSEAEVAAKWKERPTFAGKSEAQRAFFRYHNRNEVRDPVLVGRAGQIRAVLDRLGIDRGGAGPSAS